MRSIALNLEDQDQYELVKTLCKEIFASIKGKPITPALLGRAQSLSASLLSDMIGEGEPINPQLHSLSFVKVTDSSSISPSHWNIREGEYFKGIFL